MSAIERPMKNLRLPSQSMFTSWNNRNMKNS
jgi:hypothetical protein